MDALLVVDVDNGNFWPDAVADMHLRRDRLVAENIMATLREWREHGKLILFVTYATRGDPETQIREEYFGEKCLICNRRGNGRLAKFVEHRHGADFEPAFTKTNMDAFVNPKLAGFLRSRGVTRLFLAGCSTWCCLLETARGATENGFDIILLSRCIDNALPADKARNEWIDYVKKGGKDISRKPDITIV